MCYGGRKTCGTVVKIRKPLYPWHGESPLPAEYLKYLSGELVRFLAVKGPIRWQQPVAVWGRDRKNADR